VTHYQVNPMVNLDWNKSKMTKFSFKLKLENIRFQKHAKTDINDQRTKIMIFQISLDMNNRGSVMTDVLFQDGFTLKNMSCFQCDDSYFYFAFKTENFLLEDSEIIDIDLVEEEGMTYTKDSSFPTIFGVFLVSFDPDASPTVMIQNTKV